MCRFIETVRIEGRTAWNMPLHDERMNATRRAVWGNMPPLRLEDVIRPALYSSRTRCRIVYGREIERVEYFPYRIRPVHSLRLVPCGGVDYSFKYADRTGLDALFLQRGNADDVLIVRNGLLTDTSIANIALWNGSEWHTPAHPLLKGTRREELLRDGVIAEREIAVSALPEYRKICLFNAMLLFGEVELPCTSVMY